MNNVLMSIQKIVNSTTLNETQRVRRNCRVFKNEVIQADIFTSIWITHNDI